MKILFMLLVLFINPVFAEFKIGLILQSLHFDRTDRNENNYGYYIQGKHWSIGQFINSKDLRSEFIAYEFDDFKLGSVNSSFFTGIANNYEGQSMTIGEYMPLFGLNVKIGIAKIALTPIAVIFGLNWKII